MNIAPQLLRAMHDADISQATLARRVGVGRSTVTAWVQGKAKPRLDTLERIARVLRTTAAKLVGRS